jgi:cobalamin biosynthesis Mg chelatase CobN
VPDEVTPGELDRRLRDHETRTDRVHGELDSRITGVARDMVPLAVYQTAERARDAQLRRIEQEHAATASRLQREIEQSVQHVVENMIKPLEVRQTATEQRPSMTTGRWAAVILAVAAVLTLVVTVYGTLRGAGK